MDTPYLKQMQEIVRDVEKFIYDDSREVNQIASYIVGHTMMRDDYWDIIELSIHKDLEEFAEMGSSAEVLPEEYLREQDEIGYLRRAFERLKAKYGTGEEDRADTNKQGK